MYNSVCHHKQGIYAVYKGSAGSHCHKSIHIGSAMQHAFCTAEKEFVVDDHYNNGEQKLYKPHGCVISLEERRERQPEQHMPHGKIHQYSQKYQ